MKVKYIVMVLLSSFIGIMSNPELLAASDSVAVLDLAHSNLVETVVVSTPEVEVADETVLTRSAVGNSAEVATISSAEIAIKTSAVAPVAPSATNAAKTVDVAPAAPKAGANATVQNRVEFAWGQQNLIITSSTSVDAGSNAMKAGRLIWAHNNTSFNNIKSLKIGDVFTVTIDGVAKNIRLEQTQSLRRLGWNWLKKMIGLCSTKLRVIFMLML